MPSPGARPQVDPQRNLAGNRIGGQRPDVDPVEIPAARQRGVQPDQLVRVVKVARTEVEVVLDELFGQHVLMKFDLPESIPGPGLEVQRDVRGALGGIDVQTARPVGGIGVAFRAGEIQEFALELFIGRMAEGCTGYEFGIRKQGFELRISLRFTADGEIDATNHDGLTGRDVEAGRPTVLA